MALRVEEPNRAVAETQGAYSEQAWQAPLQATKSAGDAPPDVVDEARKRMLQRNAELFTKQLKGG